MTGVSAKASLSMSHPSGDAAVYVIVTMSVWIGCRSVNAARDRHGTEPPSRPPGGVLLDHGSIKFIAPFVGINVFPSSTKFDPGYS
jgi:hypothetical protein